MPDELTYHDTGEAAAGQRAGEAGAQYQTATDVVMSNRQASIPNSSLVRSPRNGAVMIASPEAAERARAGKAAKRERYRLAAEQGLLTAAQAVAAGVMSAEDGWRNVIEGQAALALSPDVRGSTQAAALVGKAIGATERDKDEAPSAPGGDLAELIAAWRQAKLDNPGLAARAAGLLAGDGEQG